MDMMRNASPVRGGGLHRCGYGHMLITRVCRRDIGSRLDRRGAHLAAHTAEVAAGVPGCTAEETGRTSQILAALELDSATRAPTGAPADPQEQTLPITVGTT